LERQDIIQAGLHVRLAMPPFPTHRAYGSYHGGSTGLSLGRDMEAGRSSKSNEWSSIDIVMPRRLPGPAEAANLTLPS
jgi:hypothetical protein